MISRKNYLILPSFQIKLVFFLILVIFLGSILHGFFLYKITARNIEEGFFSAHNRLRSTWDVLKPAIIVTNGLFFILISISLLIVTVLLSHRLIGPIFKIAGRIQEISEGKLDLPPVKLRKGDEGQVLGEAVNTLQKDFSRRFRFLMEIKQRFGSGTPPDERALREALEEALKNLRIEESLPK